MSIEFELTATPAFNAAAAERRERARRYEDAPRAEVVRDARRYEWLRMHYTSVRAHGGEGDVTGFVCTAGDRLDPDEHEIDAQRLDALIDRGMPS
jgi:hypothetical protein